MIYVFYVNDSTLFNIITLPQESQSPE